MMFHLIQKISRLGWHSLLNRRRVTGQAAYQFPHSLHPTKKRDLKVSVIIPTLDEEESISKVVAEIPKNFVHEVIIVDSSTDNTSSIAENMGVKVIREPARGYGRALQRGVEVSQGEIVVFMDGDYTYDPKEVSKLIGPITEEDHDIVLGSRFKGRMLPNSMDLLHKFGNLTISIIFSLLFIKRITDTQTGFRAIKKSWLGDQSYDGYGMEYVTEQMIRLIKRGARVTEVPITYRPRKGNTKLSPWMDGYSIIKTILKGRLFRSKVPIGLDLLEQTKYVPYVSIVVAVKNEERKLNETLESLTKIDYPHYEVVLVDAGSNDDTINIAKKFPVKIVQVSDSTPGQGRNIGIKNSSGEIIAFTDGDCVPEYDWLKNGVNLLKFKGVGGVGGPILPFEESSYLSKTFLDALSTPFANAGSTNFARYKELRTVKNIPSCNAIYRRETLEEVDSYSGDLRYCEDVDLNDKIIKKGYCILYSPDVAVKHNWKVDSFSSLFRFMLKYGAGRAVAIKKHHHLRSPLHIIPSLSVIFFLSVLAASAFVNFFDLLLKLLILSYLTLSIFFSLLSSYRFNNMKMNLIAPTSYIITHIGYALGFILGLTLKEKAYGLLGK